MGTPLGLLFFLLLILDFGSSDTELNACQKVYIADRYCCNIICNAGSQPVPCTYTDSSTTSCKPCEGNTFSDRQTQLGEYCKLKRTCIGDHMIMKEKGDASTDATCGCENGYKLSHYVHVCTKTEISTPPVAQSSSSTPNPTTNASVGDFKSGAMTSQSLMSLNLAAVVLMFGGYVLVV